MNKTFLSLLFAAALPALSTAGECRTWFTADQGLVEACVNDSLVAAGANYEFIDTYEGVGGPGILYDHPYFYLFFIPAAPIPDYPAHDDWASLRPEHGPLRGTRIELTDDPA